MTAGSGIVHDEFHSTAYSLSGGPFQMVQLWVNLPARDKMTAPGYQAIADADIPPVPLAGGAGQARLIAGQWGGARGPAHTFTPMNVWDVSLNAGHTAELPQPEGWTTLLMVLGGTVQVNGQTPVGTAQLVTLSREGSDIQLAAPQGNARVLLLSGEPIDEPVVGYGPFVMNTQQEIVQAFNDYNSGQFGQVAATAN
jgi:redox-sensitive bicupin YhaK (pirin superfamily)